MKKEIMLLSEVTPNPDAMRIISNMDFKIGEGITLDRGSSQIELSSALFDMTEIKEIYMFENFLTLMKRRDSLWDKVIPKAMEIIKHYLPFHNPDFKAKTKKIAFSPEKTRELDIIEKILDKKVRPILQSDGGDLKILDLDNNILEIEYIGACGSCPSAIIGTLKGIEEVLKNEYKPEIKVKASNKINSTSNIFY